MTLFLNNNTLQQPVIVGFSAKLGVDLVGVVDLSLSGPIIERITEDDPTEAHAHHHRIVNALPDDIAIRVANYCQAKGYYALPILASLVLGEERLLGAISHRAIAVLAGLGWQGKSLFVINEHF